MANFAEGHLVVSCLPSVVPPHLRHRRFRRCTRQMALEIVIVFAAATGRTLVLPPDTPFYLLVKESKGSKTKHHGFADFLDLNDAALHRELPIITMTEFLELEGANAGAAASGDKMLAIPEGSIGEKIRKSAEQCYYMAKSNRPCEAIYGLLREEALVPELRALGNCLIFDAELQRQKATRTDAEILAAMPAAARDGALRFCADREPVFFGGDLASAPWIHFRGGEKEYRLLNHFYTTLYFTDAAVDHYYKRFVRDFLHYTPTIWCAAGRVLRQLEEEAPESARGAVPSAFSSLHVRRGDFGYKKMKITAEDWYQVTQGLFRPGEIVYVATDEKNKTFFAPLAEHYSLRFLSDYVDAAGLKELDPNLMGMIDTIVASRGRLFMGTWLSTFTGYINRLRGYYGMPGTVSYYNNPQHKFLTHKWESPHGLLGLREWPTAWVGIDGDTYVDGEGADAGAKADPNPAVAA